MSSKLPYTSLKTLHLNLNKTYKKKLAKASLPKISENIAKSLVGKIRSTIPINHYFSKKNTTLPVTISQSKAKRINSVDINSLYPFSLINKYPIGQKNTTKKPIYIYKKKDIEKPNFQKTPYNENSLNIYPHNQINYLKKLGYQLRGTPQKYYQRNNIGIDFILHTYKKKHTHTHTKLLLNSYYGKIHTHTPFLSSLMLFYANTKTHKLRNIKNNPCCYSDTDSAFLRHPTTQTISNSIGQLKLHEIDKLIITYPRNYLYFTNNRKTATHRGVQNQLEPKTKTPKDFISIIKLLIIYGIIYTLSRTDEQPRYKIIHQYTHPVLLRKTII
uniref:Replication helicase subunit n=1 Tax=Mastigias sp. TaxID=3082107 RepID=A0AAU0H1R4_9CNID|nr:replication helicase subunit [Phyllorhiza punctata]